MNTHGFDLIKEETIPELNAHAALYRHRKTGAELLSMQTDDENKTFGITFRTPPTDSTGIAHIMEHCVLGGSRKYRVKEPFVELIKGSLQTFVNAFTSSDWTTYPVASQNVQDFYNLIDVYMDAVLYPLITPHHLDQEGWHYELEAMDDPLIYKGIVFNEMKGAYSDADSMLGRHGQSALFPDNTYGLESGGDPLAIPDLTYEQFKTFHDTLYHPANARIFFYGDDDPQERLRLMATWLDDFEPLTVESAIPLHAPFAAPRTVTHPYNVDDGDLDKKAMALLGWALPEINDPAEMMGLSVLSYALMGTPASPLRKTLIDSGMGSDVIGGGLSRSLRQPVFEAGLKGIDGTKAADVEALIVDTLSALAADGLESDMIEASVNTIEFALRENNTGRFPRGISLMLTAMRTWLHDGDPFASLVFDGPITAVKNQIANNPTYFQNLIQTYLLGNNHRALTIMLPDTDMEQRMKEEEATKLAAIKAGMSEAELQAIIDNTRALIARQSAPDSPEDLAAIPSLSVADLEKEGKTLPIAITETDGVELIHHDIFTNGILYLDIGFDLHALPQNLLPYVGLFGQLLLEMGTESEDFVKLSQRIGRKTGGIYGSVLTASKIGKSESAAYFLLRGKSTAAQASDMLGIMRDVLLTAVFDNRDRFRQIVLEAKAQHEASIVGAGHMVINGRLAAKFSEAGWASQQINGVEQLFFLRELAVAIEEDWDGVLVALTAVSGHLIKRDNMLANITIDAENYAAIRPQLAEFVQQIPAAAGSIDSEVLAWRPTFNDANEGLTIPAQVNYVGKAANLYEHGYELHGSSAVIGKYMGLTWLWDKVRVQGGAYGGFSTFNNRSGVFGFLSYRDPNLMETLQVYDETAVFLRTLDLSQEELEKTIIGSIGDIDGYQLPDAKGYTSFMRYLIGSTDKTRQRYRDQLMATTTADFKAFADVLETVKDNGIVVAMGSQTAVNDANEGDWLTVSKVM